MLEEPGSELVTIFFLEQPERGTINEDPVVYEVFGYRSCRYGRQWQRADQFVEPRRDEKEEPVSPRGSNELPQQVDGY